MMFFVFSKKAEELNEKVKNKQGGAPIVKRAVKKIKNAVRVHLTFY